MRPVEILSLLIAVSLIWYGIQKYRSHRFSKLDLLFLLVFSGGMLTVSVNPSVIDFAARLLGMEVRWFTILFISNIFLFALNIYGLNKGNQVARTVGELVRALARMEYRKSFPEIPALDKSIFIVIPAYNEENAIGGVLGKLPQKVLDHQVYPIVIVDGAKDKTEDVVRRENYMVASHAINRGQGDALRTGFEIAISQQADIVMTMDADGQHRVEDLEKLIEPIIKDEADYVMGSRFLGEYEDRGGMRHAGILMFTILINFLGRVHITDCTNGFRAIRGEKLAKLDLKEDRFNAPELIMEAAKKGLRIKEVPVTIAHRAAGESKKPRRLGYPLGFLRTIIMVWLR